MLLQTPTKRQVQQQPSFIGHEQTSDHSPGLWGPLAWEIGGFSCRITFGPRASIECFPASFRNYSISVTPHQTWPVDLRVTLKPQWQDKTIFPEAFHERDSLPHKWNCAYRAPDIEGVLTSTPMGVSGDFTIDEDPECVTRVLILAVAQAALSSGALMLHASGVMNEDGSVWLFSGDSGAGKTTIARELNAGRDPFSVDRVVLHNREATIKVAPTPFSDLWGITRRRPLAPVRGIVFIAQAATHHAHRLDTLIAAKRLLANSAHFVRGPLTDGALLERAAEIVQKVPCYDLEFSKDEGLWQTLKNAERL